jgi:hypothetical protein
MATEPRVTKKPWRNGAEVVGIDLSWMKSISWPHADRVLADLAQIPTSTCRTPSPRCSFQAGEPKQSNFPPGAGEWIQMAWSLLRERAQGGGNYHVT